MGQKYAVLISGDIAENGFPEFFFDVVLMREALMNNGFPANQIYVLYGNGSDFSSNLFPLARYRPNPAITDLSATITNVTAVFNGLANGTGGYPQLTNDDLLFIWTFDHGNGPPATSGTHCVLCLMDGNMQDDTFAGLVNSIPHAFRVICMQQCFSGGFIDDMQSDRTVTITACQDNETANPADTEAETVNTVRYPHGEYNYHLLSALNGQTVTGTAVNADADGNGFVTLREIFDYIQANESNPETPQYDDGNLNLGNKLHLSFADVHMRDNLQDNGAEPSVGQVLCCSPDINHYRQALLDPQATLGSVAARGQDNLFEDIEKGQSNYIYVRLRNRGYSATPVDIDIYWTYPSTLPTPASWNFIGTIHVANINVDQFLVAGPLEWPSQNIPTSTGHYCFVAVLGNPQDAKPDKNLISNPNDFYNFIKNNNNVVWKNFDVENQFADSYQKIPFHIQGWPRTLYLSDLEIELGELPHTVKAELKIVKRLCNNTTVQSLQKIKDTALYSHFEITSHNQAILKKMPVQTSDDTIAELGLTIPDDTPDGVYEVSVAQRVEGKIMGRVTRRLIIGDHPFMANRRTMEVHKSNCEWAKLMSPRNKAAYTQVDLALKHGYNGCKYCLPEFDKG